MLTYAFSSGMSSTEAEVTKHAEKQSTMSKKQQKEQTAESDSQKLQRLNYHIQISKRKHIIFKEMFKVRKCLKGAIYKNYQSSL